MIFFVSSSILSQISEKYNARTPSILQFRVGSPGRLFAIPQLRASLFVSSRECMTYLTCFPLGIKLKPTRLAEEYVCVRSFRIDFFCTDRNSIAPTSNVYCVFDTFCAHSCMGLHYEGVLIRVLGFHPSSLGMRGSRSPDDPVSGIRKLSLNMNMNAEGVI